MTGIQRALDAPLTADRRRVDADRAVLVAGECSSCGARAWPPRSVCHQCGDANVHEVELGREGSLLTWTRVWVASDEVEPPYTLGLVDLDGIHVFAHVRGLDDRAFQVPMPVSLVVDVEERPYFWFEPSPDDRDTEGLYE